MKTFRALIIVLLLLLSSFASYAQYTATDYLDWTKKHLDNGNCDDAKDTYALYKEKVPQGNAEVERRMAECVQHSRNLSQSGQNQNISMNGEIMYNGYRYVGQYKDNVPNGKGKLYYNNNAYVFYEGDLLDGLRHGKGKLIWKNGQRYEGDWEYDKITGSGNMFFADGDNFIGTFINGNMIKGTIYYNHGDKLGGRYEGELRNGKRWGHGTMFYSDGSYIVGAWLEDKPNGKCIAYYSDGTKEFEGTIKNGEPEGYCTYYRSDGGYYSGTYVNGKRHGYFTEVYYNSKGVKVSWYGNYYNDERDGYWYIYHGEKKYLTLKYRMGELK